MNNEKTKEFPKLETQTTRNSISFLNNLEDNNEIFKGWNPIIYQGSGKYVRTYPLTLLLF